MPRRDYSPENYNSFAEAYVAYWDDRHSDIKNPTIISEDKFAQIWGWKKKKKQKEKGLMAGKKKGFGSITKEAKSSIARRNFELKKIMED